MIINNLKNNIKYYLLFIIILFPLNFGFINSDLAIYLKGGETIVNGGKLYIDFIDIKPPMYFTSYAIIDFLINDNYRLFYVFLFLISLSTTIAVFHFITKQFNKKIAFFSSLVYSLIISTVGLSMGMNFEILFNFTILLSVIIHQKTKSYYSKEPNTPNIFMLILFGIILAYIFSSKYTFGLLSAAFLFYDIGSGNYTFPNLIKKYTIISVSFIISTILFHFWLFDPQIFAAYKDLLAYMQYYSSLPPFSIMFIRDFVKNTGIFLGDHFSILFSISTFLGLYGLTDKDINKNQKYLILVNLFVFIFLLLSAIVEKKLITYHFARSAFPLALLAGLGLNYIFNFLKNYWRNYANTAGKFAITFLVSLLLLLSPLSRYGGLIRHSYAFTKTDEEYYKFLDSNRPNFFNYYDKYNLATFINQNYPKNTKVLISSISFFDLAYLIKADVSKKFPQRTNYLTGIEFPNQLSEFAELMQQTDLFIVQRNDTQYLILSGSEKSSEQMIKENPTTNRLLQSRFVLIKETDSYQLYQSIEFGKN